MSIPDRIDSSENTSNRFTHQAHTAQRRQVPNDDSAVFAHDAAAASTTAEPLPLSPSLAETKARSPAQKQKIASRTGGMPIVAINVRLKQMRNWARHRLGIGIAFPKLSWLQIYAEGIARRYAGKPLKTVILRDLKASGVDIDHEDDVDVAIEYAVRAVETCPENSAWTSAMIGRALGVTLHERLNGFSHLGCRDETKEQKAARLKAQKKATNESRDRKSSKVSLEKQAPWLDMGIGRSTYFNRKAAGTLAAPVQKIGLKLEPVKESKIKGSPLQKQSKLGAAGFGAPTVRSPTVEAGPLAIESDWTIERGRPMIGIGRTIEAVDDGFGIGREPLQADWDLNNPFIANQHPLPLAARSTGEAPSAPKGCVTATILPGTDDAFTITPEGSAAICVPHIEPRKAPKPRRASKDKSQIKRLTQEIAALKAALKAA